MESHITREAALDLLRKYNKDPLHLRHAYRNGKKVLVLAGKAEPKVIKEDKLCGMLPEVIKG